MESIKTFVAGLVLMTFTLLFAYAATAQAQFHIPRRSVINQLSNGVRIICLGGRTFGINTQTNRFLSEQEVAGMVDPNNMPSGMVDPNNMPAGMVDPNN